MSERSISLNVTGSAYDELLLIAQSDGVELEEVLKRALGLYVLWHRTRLQGGRFISESHDGWQSELFA
jgi:hypothetical protein